MAELLEAERKPQVNEMFRCLAMEMENDDIVRSLLGQRLQSQDSGIIGIAPGSARSAQMSGKRETPVHASSYSEEPDISSGSFFISGGEGNTPMASPPNANTPSWGVPSNFQNPPTSFTQSQPLARSPPGSSNSLNLDFEMKAAQAEAEAFAWARQQSTNQHQAMDEHLSRQIRSPSPQPIQRGRLPPASAPQMARSMSPSARRSMSPNLRRSISPSARHVGQPPATTGPQVNVPPSFSIFNRGDGDVSHLISSDSEDDDDGTGEEDRRAHAAMVGLYDDLGSGGLNSSVWPSSSITIGPSSPQPLSAPKSILFARTNSGSLSRSQSGSSLELEGLPQPLSSPTGNPSPAPETPTNMNRSQRHGASYSPGTKQAAFNAASAVLGDKCELSVGVDPTAPITPVNLAARNSHENATTSPASSPRMTEGHHLRGRPAQRSTSPFMSSDRPPSLTRSNADSSEESESESDEESLGQPTTPTLQHKPPSIVNSSSTEETNDKGGTRSRSESDNSDGSSPSSVVSLAKHGWQRFVDDSSGAAYWFNENSGESSWTKPVPALAE